MEAAVDECIEKDILKDVLTKNRSEVITMFLTTFNKKMYEESLRDEGRDEMAEKNQRLERANEEMSRANEEMSRANEEMAKKIEEISKANEELINLQRIQARHLKEKGITIEDAREIMTGFSEEELAKIYGE